MIFSIETVIDLVIKLVRPVLNGKAATVSVKPEYEKAYSKAMQEGLSNRVWADCKCVLARFPYFTGHVLTGVHRSFYRDASGWNFATYPWSSYTMSVPLEFCGLA